MKTTRLRITLLIIQLFLIVPPAFSQEVGATFAWHFEEMYGGHAYQYNQSIAKKGLPNDTTKWWETTQWWENIAEEMGYSGLDYIALLSRGNQPNAPDRGNGNPKHIPKLVNAMNLRGVNFKLAIFDDCPNSWTGSKNWNESAGASYSTTPKFDCAVVDNYKYIWDYNLKEAIGHIPDDKRYKIDGRMVIYFWSVKPVWMTNIQGNLTKILEHIKTKCFETYGMYPYFIIDRDWLDNDSTLLTSPLVDAVHNWFSAANGTSASLYSWTDLKTNTVKKTGACVPGFSSADDLDGRPFLDPSMGTTNPKDNGARLKYGLNFTVKSGASTTLIEGFSDAAETAALWRSSDEGQFKYYDYPNQRLNIIRSYTQNPYPIQLKMEAETCDFNSDLTPGNSGGAFLERGDLDVLKSSDTYGGWFVTNTQANEWLEWRELPLVPQNKFEIRYKSTAAATVFISVDGVAQPTITLPATNSAWTTIDAGNYTAGTNSTHTVRLTIASGSPDINYFTRTNLITGNVNVESVAVTPPAGSVIKTKTIQLTATVTPSYASNTKVIWSSSDTSIATVDAFGIVTGINVGTAVITATSEEGAKTATANISVENPTTVITLQAEDAVFSGPIKATNQAGYNGTGFLDFTNNSGDFVKWTVTVPTAGNYELGIRYALPSGGRPMELKINGIVVMASLNFPGTGAWTNWQYVKITQALNAGSNEIMLTTIGSNGSNIDELVVTNTENLGTQDTDGVQTEKSVVIYPNPYHNGSLSIELTGFESHKEIKIKIFNLVGQTIYETSTTNSTKVELNPNQKLNKSIYFVSIEAGNTQIVKKLLVQ